MSQQKKNTALIVFIALSAIAYFTYISLRKEVERFDWSKTYSEGQKEPYDFGVFRAMLEAKAGKKFAANKKDIGNSISKRIQEDSATYVFIGRYCFLSRSEIDSLLLFAETGHQVVLIAEGIPDTLIQVLNNYGKPFSIERFDANEVRLGTTKTHSKMKRHRFKYRGFAKNMNEVTDWYYIEEDQQLSYYYDQMGDRYIPLRTINGKLNYAVFKVGEGEVYIHSSPMLFTNYAMRTESGFEYMNAVFNTIQSTSVLYDIGSRIYKPEAENIRRQSDTPLSYILKQEALRWAWYLFLLAVVLFFVFRAKRKQRIISVQERKRNTSIGFIQTLSGLFYNKANHRKMAGLKMQLFLYFIRHKLKISTHALSKETFKQMSNRSGVPEIEIESLFDYYNTVVLNESQEFSAGDLIRFHNRITQFYTLYNSKK